MIIRRLAKTKRGSALRAAPQPLSRSSPLPPADTAPFLSRLLSNTAQVFLSAAKRWSLWAVPLAALLVYAGWKEFRQAKPTYGTIYVDTPEVYTRERLVNDRNLQDAWLKAWLSDADKGPYGFQARFQTNKVRQLVTRISAAQADSAPAPEPPAAADAAALAAPALHPLDEFADRLSVREAIRTEIIENQLDDRHDLDGHTLYRLKFDSTVSPGENTHATAMVRVTIRPPLPPLRAAGPTTSLQDKHQQIVRPPNGGTPVETTTLVWLQDLYSNWLHEVARDLTKRIETATAQTQDQLNTVATQCKKTESVNAVESDTQTQQVPTAAAASSPARQEQQLLRTLAEFLTDRLVANDASDAECRCTDQVWRINCLLSQLDWARGDTAALKTWFERLFASDYASYSRKYAAYARLQYREGFRVEPRRESSVYFPWHKDDAQELQRRRAEYGLPEKPENYSDPFVQVVPEKDLVRFVENVGFLEFSFRLLSSPGGMHSYAVTPKGTSRRISTSEDAMLSSQLVLRSTQSETARLESAIDELEKQRFRSEALHLHPVVVGFSLAGTEFVPDEQVEVAPKGVERVHRLPETIVGWLIAGVKPVSDGFIHVPVQHSLSAIISVPAWWKSVTVTVHTEWLGSPDAPSPDRELTVDLPGDEAELDRLLVDENAGQEPRVYTEDMPTAHVVVGRPANIIIPGHQLWRGTTVMLGQQMANRITVLPDMNGIVAHFDAIEAPVDFSSPSDGKANVPYDDNDRATLYVWTSEGNVPVRDKVRFHAALAKVEAPAAAGSAVDATTATPSPSTTNTTSEPPR